MQIEIIKPLQTTSVKSRYDKSIKKIKSMKHIIDVLTNQNNALMNQNKTLKKTTKTYVNVIQGLSRKLSICREELRHHAID